MNVTIWIRDPYPFKCDEYITLEDALRKTYGNSSIVYMRKWPVDYVCINNTTITTARAIANTLKTLHLHHAALDKKYHGHLSTYDTQLEVVIQKPDENKPAGEK
jgi:hypothetical protein